MSTAFVTDTHPLIRYFCGNKSKLSKKVQRVFDDAVLKRAKAIYVPATVLWEMSQLIKDEKIRLSLPFEDWVNTLFKNPMIISLPFDEQTAIHYHKLSFSSDPFDKAIVASAIQLQLSLITNDALIHDRKPCDLYWD